MTDYIDYELSETRPDWDSEPMRVDGPGAWIEAMTPETNGNISVEGHLPTYGAPEKEGIVYVWFHGSPWPLAVTKKDWAEAHIMGIDEQTYEVFGQQEYANWTMFQKPDVYREADDLEKLWLIIENLPS